MESRKTHTGDSQPSTSWSASTRSSSSSHSTRTATRSMQSTEVHRAGDVRFTRDDYCDTRMGTVREETKSESRHRAVWIGDYLERMRKAKRMEAEEEKRKEEEVRKREEEKKKVEEEAQREAAKAKPFGRPRQTIDPTTPKIDIVLKKSTVSPKEGVKATVPNGEVTISPAVEAKAEEPTDAVPNEETKDRSVTISPKEEVKREDSSNNVSVPSKEVVAVDPYSTVPVKEAEDRSTTVPINNETVEEQPVSLPIEKATVVVDEKVPSAKTNGMQQEKEKKIEGEMRKIETPERSRRERSASQQPLPDGSKPQQQPMAPPPPHGHGFIRLYKVALDSTITGKGKDRVFRYNGKCVGEKYKYLDYHAAPSDPRSKFRRTEPPKNLLVPKMLVDDQYTGIPPKREVTISNLSDNVNKEFLTKMLMNQKLEAEEVLVIYHPTTKKHLNMALILFKKSSDARAFVEANDGHNVMGIPMTCILDPFAALLNSMFVTATKLDCMPPLPYLQGMSEHSLSLRREEIVGKKEATPPPEPVAAAAAA
ncbi:hypothetical protein PFISCL1PPCAC_11192, partial [Pristionchus fissidentatus]